MVKLLDRLEATLTARLLPDERPRLNKLLRKLLPHWTRAAASIRAAYRSRVGLVPGGIDRPERVIVHPGRRDRRA